MTISVIVIGIHDVITRRAQPPGTGMQVRPVHLIALGAVPDLLPAFGTWFSPGPGFCRMSLHPPAGSFLCGPVQFHYLVSPL